MGVRGLTTYISRNAEKYLVPFELHDCNLVIDGDNLASQLFNKSNHSTFGGNYDEYYKLVITFFAMLKKCNITAYVLMDGGYEERKMKTIQTRLQTRITAVKYALPLSRRPVIPLFMREVFIDALKASNIPVMRCMFEADDEIAILARKLDCPVLSYDSDFFIHNVMYIPFVTLTHKVYKKKVEDDRNYEIEVISNGGKSKKKKGKNSKKIIVSNKDDDKKDTLEEQVPPKEEYCYLDCCLYTIESLIGGKRALQKEMLPLFAILLGNDFIKRRVFKKFYSNVKIRKGRKRKTPQQERIKVIFEWLKNENLKSALQKILGAMKLSEREKLLQQIKIAMSGYNSEESVAYDFFGFIDDDPVIESTEFNVDSLILDSDTEEEEEEESEESENDEESESEKSIAVSDTTPNLEETASVCATEGNFTLFATLFNFFFNK